MKNLLPLNTEVCVCIMSHFIKSARCDRKAGLIGRCSHVAVALLMLSNYILENGHAVEKTSTSLPCSWNNGKKWKKTHGNFTSQCMNPVSENILVICTIGIPDQVNIEDSLGHSLLIPCSMSDWGLICQCAVLCQLLIINHFLVHKMELENLILSTQVFYQSNEVSMA